MRKKILLPVMFLSIFTIFSESEDKDSNRFSFNWSVGFHGQPDAFHRVSVLSLGYMLVKKSNITIQNHIEFSNGVLIKEDEGVTYYKKVFIDKITVGKFSNNGLFHPYGFIEGGAGFCGLELYDVFSNPSIINFGLGTGLDIYATPYWSFSLEIGFLGHYYKDSFIPQQGFELGVMYRF